MTLKTDLPEAICKGVDQTRGEGSGMTSHSVVIDLHVRGPPTEYYCEDFWLGSF